MPVFNPLLIPSIIANLGNINISQGLGATLPVIHLINALNPSF